MTTLAQPIGPPGPPRPSVAGEAGARTRSGAWPRLLTFTFLVALVLPNLDLVFRLDPNPSPVRVPVTFPVLFGRQKSIVHYPGELLGYLKDNMGFRGTLVRARGLIAWQGLGISPAPDQVIRADPWLFFRGERVLDDFRRVYRFTDAELDGWADALESRRVWLAKSGIQFLVVIPPNKETVYAELLPASITRDPATSRLTQLGERLKARTGVQLLDLSHTLTAHKSDGRLYHLTDTHWNDLGALVGYRAIMARLAPWFPQLRPLDDDEMKREEVVTRGGDLARICGLPGDLLEPQLEIRVQPTRGPVSLASGKPLTFDRLDVRQRDEIITRAPHGEIARAMIVRDSFGEALLQYLAPHFQTADWIWSYDFPTDLIERRHPALVIEELVERKLMSVKPARSPAAQAQ